MNKPIIEINDWSGGMTLSSGLGKANQFYTGYNVDFNAKRGKITCSRSTARMRFDSNVNLPTQFRDIIQTSDDEIYFGGGDTKIYNATGYSTLGVSNDSAQAGAIDGMAEYKGYLYYGQATTIGRFNLDATWDDDWQTGLESSPHRMHVAADNNLYIANGKYVAKWDGTTFTSDVLDLSEGWIVNDINDFGENYLAIGATFYAGSGKPAKSKIFLWDKIEDTWVDAIYIPERLLHTMIFKAGYLWVWAGQTANLYVISDGSRKATKMLNFHTEDEGALKVYPGAVTHRDGVIYFGLSDSGAADDINDPTHPQNPCGIYSFSVDPENFTLNLKYIKLETTTTFYSINHIINSSVSSGLYFCEYYYQDPSAGWITNLRREMTVAANEALYNIQGYAESFEYLAPVGKKFRIEAFALECEPLPAGTIIQLEYQLDNDGSWTTVIEEQLDDVTESIKYRRLIAKSIKIRISASGSAEISYLRPFIKRVYVTGGVVGRGPK